VVFRIVFWSRFLWRHGRLAWSDVSFVMGLMFIAAGCALLYPDEFVSAASPAFTLSLGSLVDGIAAVPDRWTAAHGLNFTRRRHRNVVGAFLAFPSPVSVLTSYMRPDSLG